MSARRRLLTLVPLIGRDSLAPERLDLMVKDALIFVGRIDTGALGNGGQHRVELREAMSELRPATTHRS